MNILVIVLIVLLLGGGGGYYGHGAGWNMGLYGGGFGGILVVILVLYLLGII